MTRPVIVRLLLNTKLSLNGVSLRFRVRVRNRLDNQGFALILVIWGLGLVSLLALGVIATERSRMVAAANIIENARADAFAEAGINLVRQELASSQNSGASGPGRVSLNGEPLICGMPEGAVAALSVEDEGGKVDLNTAGPKLLSALLRGVGVDRERSDSLSNAIAEYSHMSTNSILDNAAIHAYQADGRNYGPKKAPFDTILELDQVIGMDSQLLRKVLPYVTVYSRKPGIDPTVAAPALLAAIAGDEPQRFAPSSVETAGNQTRNALARNIPAEFLTQSSKQSFLVRAEVRTAAGGLFTREAALEIGGGAPAGIVREWRRGESRFGSILSRQSQRSEASRSLQRC